MAHKDDVALMRPVERDLRLDLLRGLGLWMIFLDHIPNDVVAWLTLRNYGFSDAAEFFVFISGYLAGLHLRSDHSRRSFSRCHQAAMEAGRANVRRPHHAVPDLHGADRPHGQEIRQSDV